MKKTIIAAIFLIFLTSLYFKENIHLAIASWYINQNSLLHFGSKLDYEQAYIHDGKIIFHHPRLGSSKAERLTIDYRWTPQGIHAQFETLQPEIFLDQPHNITLQDIKEQFSSRSYIISQLNIHLEDAVIHLPDNTVHFELNLNSEPQTSLELKTWFDAKDRFLQVKLNGDQKDKKSIVIYYLCHDVDAQSFLKASQTVFTDLKGLTVQSGLLNGEGFFTIKADRQWHGDGALTIHNLAFEYAPLQLSGAIDNASIRFLNPAKNEQKKIAEVNLASLQMTIFENFNLHLQGQPKALLQVLYHPLINTLRYCSDQEILVLDIENAQKAKVTLQDEKGNKLDIAVHQDVIQIDNVGYIESKVDFPLTDIKGNFHLDNEKISLQNAEAFANGVYFNGEIQLDFQEAKEGKYRFLAYPKTIYGTTQQFRQLTKNYEKAKPFSSLPIEGNLSLTKEAAIIEVSIDPRLQQGYALNTQLQGVLTEGKFLSEELDLAIHDLSFNFNFDFQKDFLGFTDIQGILLLGKPDKVDEYTLSGDKVNFKNYRNNELEFDIWIGNKKRDILRLAGTGKKEGESTSFIFDHHLTHFGNVHPTKIQLSVKEGFTVDNFYLESQFTLETLFRDLQRFSKSGMFYLSKGFLAALNGVKDASGAIAIDIHYDSKLAQYLFNVYGDNLSFNDEQIKTFVLNGKKQESLWSIENLQIDAISLSTDLVKEEDNWKINFLGFRLADSLMLGLEGYLYPESNHIDAQLKLLELNVNNIPELALLKHFSSSADSTGILRATGKVGIDFLKGGKENLLVDVALISNGYTLKGLWNYSKQAFKGTLEGKNSTFAGYPVESLSTTVDYSPSAILLRDVEIYNKIGEASIPEMVIHHEKSQMPFETALINLKNFRPGASQSGQEPSFFVNTMEVRNLKGSLNDPSSYSGEGVLHFNNNLKKSSFQQLFAVPNEMINRLGLDTRVLNPTSGTIFYKIEGNKLYFTKFKDVYSEGKMSKFSLSKSADPSYIDLDGNLNLKLKIKQYNLLFKLTEFLTFSIQGTLQNPRYTIEKG